MRQGNFFLKIIVFSGLVLFIPQPSLSESYDNILSVFDHQFHEKKVFEPQKIDCSRCHNFSLDPSTKKVIPTLDLKFSSFKKPYKEICHSCHTGGEKEYSSAPRTCYTCHRSFENILVIKPRDHENLAWKSAHSTAARVNGQSCMNCHMVSQCVKCHLRREDVEPVNHSRNFRYYHSLQVRQQPHRCDACHTKTFCVKCHLGN